MTCSELWACAQMHGFVRIPIQDTVCISLFRSGHPNWSHSARWGGRHATLAGFVTMRGSPPVFVSPSHWLPISQNIACFGT